MSFKSLLLLISCCFIGTTLQRSLLFKRDAPTNCTHKTSDVTLQWSYDELSSDLVFKLTAKAPSGDFYTSIAFGDKKPTDTISVYVRSGQIGLIDGHVTTDGSIESDEKTNVQALSFDLEDGVLTAQFARPLETIDADDEDLIGCMNVYVPESSQRMMNDKGLVLHEKLTAIRVCDVSTTCNEKHHEDAVVKRQEEAMCASGPKSQKNRVEWKMAQDKVIFSFDQNAKKGKWWSAIGVGEGMADLNMVVVFAENGKIKNQGIYRTEGKMQPQELMSIDLERLSASTNNNRAHFEIGVDKKFVTERMDSEGCVTFQVGVLAGPYRANFGIGKHNKTPERIHVCNLNACGQMEEKKTTTTKKPAMDQLQQDELVEKISEGASGEMPEGSGMIDEKVEFSSTVNVPKQSEDSVEEKVLTSGDAVPAKNIDGEAKNFQIIDGATSGQVKKIDDETSTQVSEIKKIVEAPACGDNHLDLDICDAYFTDYLHKVDDWSKRHEMSMSEHMWKACTLLSQVDHVTTMCCSIFRKTCAAHLDI